MAGDPASVHLVLPIDAVEPGAQDQRAGGTGQAAIVNPKTAPSPPDPRGCALPLPGSGPAGRLKEEKGGRGPVAGFQDERRLRPPATRSTKP